MNSHRFSLEALEDLDVIWQWVAADDVRAADRSIADIKSACGQIAEHPNLGGRHTQWTRKPVRFFLIRTNYWIVYDPESKPLEIMRIVHAARDIARILSADS